MKIWEGEIIGRGSTLVALHKVGETKKSYIVEVRQGKIKLDKLFLPKSQVRYTHGVFEIPEWLAKKLLLRDYAEVIKQCAKIRPEWLDDLLSAIDRITSKTR